MSEHDQHLEALGAYALGALPDGERSEIERHLATCHDCRREADALLGVVAGLPEAAEPVHPPPHLRERILAVVESEAAARRATAPVEARPWWGALLRPQTALVAACVLLLAGLGAGIALVGGENGGRWDAEVVMADASAEVDMAGDHATLAVRGMPPPPAGRVYQVWVQRDASAPRPTQSLFTVGSSGSATVEVRGEMRGVDAVLVTDEPKGGSRAPTRSPVIIARPS